MFKFPTKFPTQFAKFVVVGLCNTAIDFAVYIVLTRGLHWFSDHLVVASVVSFLCASINSYLLNKRWTFTNQRRDHHVLLVKFFVVTGSSFVLYSMAFAWLVSLGFYDLLVKFVLIGFIVVWNFVLSKLWVYTKR
ncbi:MAG: GtrA family protein [uncultured bacterium]|nr:MAG: GtrA family protein [uncultured bacterium]